MTSLDKAKQFVTEKSTLTAIKGSDDVEVANFARRAGKGLQGE